MAQTFHFTVTDQDDDSWVIRQGATFDRVTFLMEEDYSGWSARGQIRDRYRQDGGVVKASFAFSNPLSFTPVAIDGVTRSYTAVKPILSAATTDALLFDLKIRPNAYAAAIPGKNVWVYDIQIVSPDSTIVYPVSLGYVEVLKEVTQP